MKFQVDILNLNLDILKISQLYSPEDKALLKINEDCWKISSAIKRMEVVISLCFEINLVLMDSDL